MARFIIAPVGLQPAAVLAPLLSSPVLPNAGDSLLLIGSDESIEAARRISAIVRNVTSVDAEVLFAKTGVLSEEIIERVSDVAQRALSGGGEIGLVMNGGDGAWLHQLLDLILTASKGAESRAWLASSAAVGGHGSLFLLDDRTAGFEVADIPRNTLFKLLNLRLIGGERDGKLELNNGARRKPLIEGIFESGIRAWRGSLYACVDSRVWPQTNKKRLQRYRKLLRYGFLQDLGLEARLLLLQLPDDSYLKDRAERDGIETTAKWKNFEAFFSAKTQAATKSQPSPPQTPGLPPSRFAQKTHGERALLTILGPNPGPTLQVMASHGNKHVVLLCDEDSLPVCTVAHRIKEICRDRTIEFVPMGGFDSRLNFISKVLSDERFSRPFDINVSPGEKLRRLFLQYWARRQNAGHHLWVLDRSTVRSIDGKVAKTGRVPLNAWLGVHSDQKPDFRGPRWSSDRPVPDLIGRMARSVLDYYRSPDKKKDCPHALWAAKAANLMRLSGIDLSSVLGKMGLRLAGNAGMRISRVDGGPITKSGAIRWPRPYSGDLVVPRHGAVPTTFSLAAFARIPGCGSIPDAFLPMGWDKGGNLEPNGRWFEWVVAALLAEEGVEEIQLTTEIGARGRWFDDEFDIVSTHQGAYVFWSCKTGGTLDTINPAAENAAGTAQRFFGRAVWTVVVVPRVGEFSEDWRKIAQGRWRIDERTDLVDLSLWENPNEILRLASEGSGSSRRYVRR